MVCGAVLLATAAGCAPYRLYWGDVHGHTLNSDGRGTVREYFAYARDTQHLVFAIVTDHDFGHAAPWRMPNPVWRQTQADAQAATVEGRFIAISGYEWTSQPKYWAQFKGATPSERLFEGPPEYYNHKVVYFPGAVPRYFSAKDPEFMTPDLLAAAVRNAGGLIHNAHPDATPEGLDQWAYTAASAATIRNTEIAADVMWYQGKRYELKMEQTVRDYLDQGGRTGFLGGSDTHEGKPVARTAVLARGLRRETLFEALRQRRCYAISHARIALDFKIDGHWMGEEIRAAGKPAITVNVRGTDRITELALIRNGAVLHTRHPNRKRVSWRWVDDSFNAAAYYYVRVTQADTDPHGNPSRAWSSPIWVTPPVAQ
jgi:hypothetical protein